MSNKFVEKSPFTREGTASHAIYMALAKAGKPLTMAEISKRAKVSFDKTQTLVRAYMNPYHNAPMRRAGIAIVSGKEGFKLESCKAEANATRPPRGETGKVKKPKPKIVRKAAGKKQSKPQTVKAAPAAVAPASNAPSNPAQSI